MKVLDAGHVLVRATADGHARVERCLADVRRQMSRHVTVQCRVYDLRPTVLDALPGHLRDKVTEARTPIPSASAGLTAAEVQELSEALAAAGPDVATVTAPRITLLVGQRAWVRVATEQPYVAEYDAAVNDVTMGTIDNGIALQTEATLVGGTDRIALAVDFRSATLLGLSTDDAQHVQVPRIAETRVNRVIAARSGDGVLLAAHVTGHPPEDDRVRLLVISPTLLDGGAAE